MLCQLSYTPAATVILLGFPMKGVLPTPRAVLVELDPVRIVLLVLARRVRPLLALGAGELERGSRFYSCHVVIR